MKWETKQKHLQEKRKKSEECFEVLKVARKKETELEELKEELKVINKHLLDKKKMNNTLFKELMVEKDELEKLITEVEIEVTYRLKEGVKERLA
jgi:hypothetical protein